MKKIINILLILFLLTSCRVYQEYPSFDGFKFFDIAPDDSKIVFSYSHKSPSNKKRNVILLTDINGENNRILTPHVDGITYHSICFSNNGDLIACQKAKKLEDKVFSYSILLLDTLGVVRDEFTDLGEGYVTDIRFSIDAKTIYYAKAKKYQYNKGLKMVVSDEHDIYAIDIASRKINQITFLKASYIANISNFSKDTILVTMPNKLLLIPVKEKDSIIDITPINFNKKYPLFLMYSWSPDKNRKIYYLDNFNTLFYYDYHTKIIKKICNAPIVLQIRLFHKQNKICYSYFSPKYSWTATGNYNPSSYLTNYIGVINLSGYPTPYRITPTLDK